VEEFVDAVCSDLDAGDSELLDFYVPGGALAAVDDYADGAAVGFCRFEGVG
jgi:hypothetical protein